MTIAQRRILRAANARRHAETCARCQADDLVEALKGSQLWRQLQTPMSNLIDQLRAQGKS